MPPTNSDACGLVSCSSVACRFRSRRFAYLDERLYLGLLLELGLAQFLRDLARVTIDAGDQRMSELLLGGAVVEGLDHNGLATGVTSAQDDYDFASFHNLTHLSANVEERER